MRPVATISLSTRSLQENDFHSTYDDIVRIERQYKCYFDEMIDRRGVVVSR